MTKQQEISMGIFNILLEAQGSIRPEHHPNVLQYKILAYLHSQDVFIAKHGFYSDLMEPLIEETDAIK